MQKGCEAHCSDDQFRCHNNLCISMKWLCDGQEDCKMGEDEKNCQETGEETSHHTLNHRAVLLCATFVVHNIVCIASVKNSIYSYYSFVGQRNIFFLSTVNSSALSVLCVRSLLSPTNHSLTDPPVTNSESFLRASPCNTLLFCSCAVLLGQRVRVHQRRLRVGQPAL